MTQKPRTAIIGAGKVGSALALLLKARGYPLAGIASKSFASACRLADLTGAPAFDSPLPLVDSAELVFITTPDREIAPVSAYLAEAGAYHPGQVVAHTSGAHSADELLGVRQAGALAVSIHPLQSFADLDTARRNLPGSYFALEGDTAALPLAEQIVSDLGGKSFHIRAQDKPLYHAAACIASNYLVALLHFATGLYEKFGLSRQEAFAALKPLVQGTLNNIAAVGPVQALTGPIARGDLPTLRDHLPALAEAGDHLAHLYRALGQYTVNIALEKGTIDHRQAQALTRVLKEEQPHEQPESDHGLLPAGQTGGPAADHAHRL